jgi:hypothetical protein
MDYITPQKPRFWQRKWSGFGGVFLFFLIFLLVGSTPSLLNLSGLRARFTGVETTALATAAGSCSSSDDENDSSFYYTYTFTDSHGKAYQITNTSACSSGIVSDGERVTIWYQADDPTQFITANDLTFDSIFFAGFSIPMLLLIAFFSRALFRQLFVNRRRYERIDLYS